MTSRPRYTAAQVRARLDRQIAAGRAIVAAGAGSGLTAKCAALGGADLLVVYNSGRHRMAGLPSLVGYLPVGDANAEVLEMGRRQIFPVAGDTPVIAGVLGVDPTREIPVLLEEVRAAGFAGVINFPTVGRMDGAFRRALEQVGLGYRREAAMIAQASRLGLFTLAYCFTPAEAATMARSGADVVVAHLKTTAGGLVGLRRTAGLASAFRTVRAIFAAARRAAPRVLCFAHGGPLATPRETAALYRETGAVGFVAASSVERLATETAVVAHTRAFKAQRLAARTVRDASTERRPS
ncbi:MAG: phosphoenolpyruvate hydrolase family protein [Candidatus Rokubacteria bacterium]|nr:phosphoenolpyruvate hydrolase family protein [Candidatus Rokubacteria bacterium]